ncbi:MAG: sugar phosphate nucleotidyltransferase [Flavobacteriaceae bacterium]
MKIVVPMSGMGNRFLSAGYKDPKPLIEVDGMPIIEHVVKMFPGEKDFIFICNSLHLKQTGMRSVLERIAPEGKIMEIEPHKLGPVYAVHLIDHLLDEEEEVIVNYCDFSCFWDYDDFLNHTRSRKADGAVPAYKGFHPHMLGDTNYAFMREQEQWMLEIKEKEPFTNNRMEEYASMGTYYFRKGAFVKKYFKRLIDLKLDLKGEYYVSLIYNLLVEDNLKVSIYKVQHMLQWGTPQDLEEYQGFSDYFTAIAQGKGKPDVLLDPQSINLIPLAGQGSRFIKEGYQDPKPLIEVGGKPMIIQAADSLPRANKNIFVCLQSHLSDFPLAETLEAQYPGSKIIGLDHITQGQACTCEIGLKGEDPEAALLIGACDNGMLWNTEVYTALINDETVDAIIWSFRNHPSSERNPQMYGWIKVDDQLSVKGVSVKVPISENPKEDHAIVGTFYFRKAQYFEEALKRMYEKDIRVNGEFYVDSCVNELVEMGLKVKVFELDHYVGWGTPNDLLTYRYWQSFFHKADWHPYSLDKDITLAPGVLDKLEKEVLLFQQEWQ